MRKTLSQAAAKLRFDIARVRCCTDANDPISPGFTDIGLRPPAPHLKALASNRAVLRAGPRQTVLAAIFQTAAQPDREAGALGRHV